MNHVTSKGAEQQSASTVSRLVDRFGRVHRSLRVSVTDVCNIRCQYCMPEEGAQFLGDSKLLSYEQIEQFVAALIPLGVTRVRITGGEPLMRKGLPELVTRIRNLEGLEDLALTTNGMLLRDRLPSLAEAGLQRLNISLDTLSESTFQRLSRRSGLEQVLDGVEAAVEYGLTVKLNALILRDVNLADVLDLVDYSSARGLDLRFIEFMPCDAEKAWAQSRVVTGQELREIIESKFGPLREETPSDPSRPSRDFRLENRAGRVGFIDTVSNPFCGQCDRLRLTADGKVRNCLFGQEEWDVRQLLNESCDPHSVQQRVQEAVLAKHPSHGIAEAGFQPPQRAMYQIGG